MRLFPSLLCLAFLTVSATGCKSQAQNDKEAQEQLDKDQVRMMQKLLEVSAERQLSDGGEEDAGAKVVTDPPRGDAGMRR